jgi:hypothetical protein
MKVTLTYLLLLLLLISGCSKDEDPVFDQTADERTNETLLQYETALISAPDGWNAQVLTGTGHLFHFHFRFNDKNRVTMYADIDTTTAGTAAESSYRLKALQQPALIFDTYSYLHILADPDGSVNGGEDGEGLKSDFEFSIDTVTTDSIKLTGRFNGSKVTLRRASQEDAAAWQNGDWRRAVSFQQLGRILEYFKRMPLNGVIYEIRLNQQVRSITFIWMDAGGNTRTFTSNYYFDTRGIMLETPLENGNRSIRSLSVEGFDAATNQLRVRVNDETPAAISGAVTPVRRDLESPSRWWQAVYNQETYWQSNSGFHVNGVDDAFRIRNIPNFTFLLFWPAFGIQDGIIYDLTGFVLNNNGTLGIGFGAAWLPPEFTNDGRIIFSIYGTLGTIPTAARSAFDNTAALFADPSGFYLIQTGAFTYDMVSARDARAWISWQ